MMKNACRVTINAMIVAMFMLNASCIAADPRSSTQLFDGKGLGKWSKCDYIQSGEVSVKDGAIHLTAGTEQTAITFGGPIHRSNYEITLEAMRVSGKDFFCALTFPVKDEYCTLVVGGWGGKVVGLSNIDTEDAAENETAVLIEFETGMWYPIRLQVTDDRIVAWIEGDRVVNLDITERIIGTRPEVDLCRPLGIMTWKTAGAVRDIGMRQIDPANPIRVRHASKMSVDQRKELAARILSNKDFPVVMRKGAQILKSGFNAGDGYGQVWIRDLNTFIELSCRVNDKATIKSNLLKFFEYQCDDGNIVDGFVSSTGKTHKNTVETDQETSLIQAVYKYVKVTGDKSILAETVKGRTVADRMSDAMEFLMTHRYSKEYGLLWGATTADWGDVQPKDSWGVYLSDNTDRSIDIYDNAMFVIALNNLLKLTADDPASAKRWEPVRRQIIDNIRMHLWTGTKFVPHLYLKGSPWPDDFNEKQIFYMGGTAIAIESGVLDRDEAGFSFEQMIDCKRRANADSIGLTLYPPYPKGFFANPQMENLYSYQNGGDWTWFGARAIEQMIRLGFVEAAYAELDPMTRRVIKNKGFFEWYSVDGKPRGSGTFRGSAGVLGKSIDMLTTWAKNNQ